MDCFRRRCARLSLVSLALIGGLAPWSQVFAQEGGLRCVKVHGALLARKGAEAKPVKAGDSVPAGVELISLFQSELEPANKAVLIELRGDIGEFGPLPVLDTAVQVRSGDKADASLVLERGLLILTNKKSEGAATVLVKLLGEEVEVRLKSPETKLGIELYGRHPGGAGGILKDNPTAFVYILISKGEATIAAKDSSHALTAPPGGAFFRWDSVTKHAEVVAMDKFPEEFKRNDQEWARFDAMNKIAAKLNAESPEDGALRLAGSDDPLERRVGVTALGALDDLPDLLTALEDPKHKDVREQAILTLRAWMGRAPGQLKALRGAMLKHQYTMPQAKTTMHLLFGFDDQERVRPVVYELLIASLDHKSVAVRELAHWHLIRLAPAGRDIAYDAGAPDADRQAAIERWRKLIPAGEAPRPPKTEKK